MTLTGGRRRELRYSDPRRFGIISLVRRGDERSHPSLAELGVDPLLHDVTGDMLHAMTRGRRSPIKAFLLDQRFIAGIGNIYASEALWQARIRPTARAGSLSRPRARALAEAIRDVLDRALDHGGTSLRDFVHADGNKGSNSEYLLVYPREGAPCPRPGCAGAIRRTVIQGRATFHCPRCQH
jgi:formamidopyrimidine-DNA glycosylase